MPSALQLTERCNLACRYCYVRRRRHPDPVDCTTDLCERFVAFALRESGERVKITFFGGEPLLRPDLIGHTVARGRQAAARHGAKTIGFHLVTNGTLLDDETGLHRRRGIGLEVSLDGPEEIHDANRRYTDGFPELPQGLQESPALRRAPPRSPGLHLFGHHVGGCAPLALGPLPGVGYGGSHSTPPARPGEEGRAGCRRTTARALRKRIDAHREAFLRGDTGAERG